MQVDIDTIKRAQGSDVAAFNQIVLTCRGRVMKTIARLIARPEDVEDVAQEVFVHLYFSLGRLRAPEAFDLWLHRITVNAAHSYLRHHRCRERRLSDLSEGQMAVAEAAAGRDVALNEQYRQRTRESIDELLGAVSEADRILLTLKEVEGLSLKELEKIYKVNENALKVRLFRARHRLLGAVAGR